MNNGTKIDKKRAALLEKEQNLLSSIDHQSDELEEKLAKTLKTSAIVGLSVLAGYLVYRIISPEDEKPKKKKQKEPTKKSGPSELSKNIVSTIVKNSLPLVLGYISDLSKNDEKEKQPAK